MGDSEAAKPAVKCPTCGQTVTTFSEWFTADCPSLDPQRKHVGHLITWAERTALPLGEETQ